jgi:hypothetical protein
MNPEYYYYMAIGLLPALGAIALLSKKTWHVLAAAAVTSMFVFYTSGVVGLGRYSASVWPAFLPLGVFLSSRPALQAPVVIGLAMLQGVFFFLFSHQYRVF